jgi:mRNA interferase RelE/StbE
MQTLYATQVASISELKKTNEEWQKLLKQLQEQFKKLLKRRLENLHVISAKLSGQLKDCYKIKLHQAGYGLVYQVNDNKMIFLDVAVGKRNKNKFYESAEDRQEP